MTNYASTQVLVTSKGNNSGVSGYAPLHGHHTSKIVSDGTYYYVIATTNEDDVALPYNFRIFRIDPRQETPIVAEITYKQNAVYQVPTLLIDRDKYLHVFYIETNTDDASVGTTRTLKHYKSTVVASSLTNTSITAGQWTLITSITNASIMHGYISAAYYWPSNTIFLAYNDDSANLKLARNANQSGWGTFNTIKASSVSHVGGQLYRALYAQIVPTSANAVDLLWVRAYNNSNYDQVIYKRVTDVDAGTADADVIILDKSPGPDDSTLRLSNPYMFRSINGNINIMYWDNTTNEHFFKKRTASGFQTAVSITDADLQARGYRQYGVFIEQRYPIRLHAFISPSSSATAPDNGLAHFWSDDEGDTWTFEQDIAPPLATTSQHDYPDLLQTYNERGGSSDNRLDFVVLYNGIHANTTSNYNVVLELLEYEELDSEYITFYDIEEIIKNLLTNYWQTHYGKVPQPRMFLLDDKEDERINLDEGDILVIRADASADEETIGHLFYFRSISIPIDIEINTNHSRQRLLDLQREITRIIYSKQISYADIGNFHRLAFRSFQQMGFDENDNVWKGTVSCELSAAGIPVLPVSSIDGLY